MRRGLDNVPVQVQNGHSLPEFTNTHYFVSSCPPQQLRLMEDPDPKGTAREQRRILRTLRNNSPNSENRIVLTDGDHAIYQDGDNGRHKPGRKRLDLFQLPCDERYCYLDELDYTVINPWATTALWKMPPPDMDPCCHCGGRCGHIREKDLP